MVSFISDVSYFFRSAPKRWLTRERFRIELSPLGVWKGTSLNTLSSNSFGSDSRVVPDFSLLGEGLRSEDIVTLLSILEVYLMEVSLKKEQMSSSISSVGEKPAV